MTLPRHPKNDSLGNPSLPKEPSATFHRVPQRAFVADDHLRPLRPTSQRTSLPRSSGSRISTSEGELPAALTPSSLIPNDHLQERRRQKQWLLQLRRARLLVRFFLGLTLLVLLVMAIRLIWQPVQSGIVWQQSPRFITSPTLEAALKPLAHQPVWLVNPQVAETLLRRQSPMVSHVSVRRQGFPPRLVVSVTEHTPWAVWYRPPQPGSWPVSAAGTPPVTQLTPHPPKYWIIPPFQIIPIGAHQPQALRNAQQYILHPPYPLVTLWGDDPLAIPVDQWQELQHLAQLAHQLPDIHLQAINVSSLNNVQLVCQGPDIWIGPLNGTWRQRFQRLAGVLPHLNQWDPHIDAVDLRWEGQVTLQKKTSVGASRLLQPTPPLAE
ncbi:MAG: FtsQ-type POTRA domain-containing protein [Vampirovibrionales bacterium]